MKQSDNASAIGVELARRIEFVSLDELEPYAGNPKLHPPEQLESLAAAILKFGFVNPILVAHGIIRAGHGRLKAAKLIESRSPGTFPDGLPIVRLDHLSERDARAYLIADNKLAELSAWDDDALAMELAAIAALDPDGDPLAGIGFTDEELASILGDELDGDGPPAADTFDAPDRSTIVGSAEIIHGNSLDVMRSFGPETFSAVVSDPPYGLGFMGKEWDRGVPGVEFWTEALRVLKPGAHLVAFGGSRTYHRLAVAIEDAGFEIRDCLSWLYATGFPKSHDVARGIDAARTEDLEPVRVVCRYLRAAMDAADLNSRVLAPVFECNPRLVDHWAARDTDSQPALPTNAQWDKLRGIDSLDLGDEMDAEVLRLNGRKGSDGEDFKSRDVVGTKTGPDTKKIQLAAPRSAQGLKTSPTHEFDITAPKSEAAKTWSGYGTALKPAWEPIILARKPFPGTVAENVQLHGTGALNIDGTRIPTDDSWTNGSGFSSNSGTGFLKEKMNESDLESHPAGRWPANVTLDLEAGMVLEEQSEGASRFFFTPKPSTDERDAGGAVENSHATVKPIDLMRWLVRLVSAPEGSRILDPFAGSGTTLVAAIREGVDSVGIELEEDHVIIARERLKAEA